VRNPDSTRPYQHVLEPVVAYLTLAAEQYNDISKADSYNIGPDEGDCVTTGMLVDLFCSKWNEVAKANGLAEASWVNKSAGGPHEAGFLKLDSSKIKAELNIFNRWHIDTEMDKVVEWTAAYLSGRDTLKVMDEQIKLYMEMV
jgi:CDP-glucose 4,6-dehydratase